MGDSSGQNRDFHRVSQDVLSIAGAEMQPAENFEKLFADVEELLQTEIDSFFKFRITQWKPPERSS